jgi:hypothetical protein
VAITHLEIGSFTGCEMEIFKNSRKLVRIFFPLWLESKSGQKFFTQEDVAFLTLTISRTKYPLNRKIKCWINVKNSMMAW